MASSTLWSRIDPSAEFRVAPEGGYTNTDETPSAGYSTSTGPFFSPSHQHFGFLVLIAGGAALLYYIYEGKPSGAKVEANVGPLEGEIGGGVGEE